MGGDVEGEGWGGGGNEGGRCVAMTDGPVHSSLAPTVEDWLCPVPNLPHGMDHARARALASVPGGYLRWLDCTGPGDEPAVYEI